MVATSVIPGWAGRVGGGQVVPRPEVWRLGERPAWTAQGLERLLDRDRVVEATLPLGDLSGTPPLPDRRPAAVLVALLEGTSGCEVVLTRRAAHLRHHRGEISFPGGRLDPGEHVVDAALREAEEEIGLKRSHVDIIGGLMPVTTHVSASYIVPVVARCRAPKAWRPNPGEVDRVFTVRLHDLTRPDTYRSEWWGAPPDDRELHFFELDDETIWGATGRLLRSLIDRVVVDRQ